MVKQARSLGILSGGWGWGAGGKKFVDYIQFSHFSKFGKILGGGGTATCPIQATALLKKKPPGRQPELFCCILCNGFNVSSTDFRSYQDGT